jgi:putative Ca2+/H+ antiporter (TMEM165/GDT1 family)
MVGALEIFFVAFTTQLAVLPGEKVQFIIAGLSTRFNPFVVVAAAGSAFAGWTVLEILFGNALQQALPKFYLDLLTASLFLAFAIMLYRSAPGREATATKTDGGIASLDTPAIADRVPNIEMLGGRVPKSIQSFAGIFTMMAVGEFGDKTQIVTIGLAAQFGASPAIWAGEMAAIIPVSLANALFFNRFAHRFDLRKAHFGAAALFAFFAVDMLQSLVTGFSVWEFVVGTASEFLLALFGVIV